MLLHLQHFVKNHINSVNNHFGWREIKHTLEILGILEIIRNELLSRINQIYYTTHEQYNYLQLIKSNLNRKLFTKDT